MNGKLIVIEGLDGCGKTTQTALLAETLSARGVRVRTVSFPDYGSPASAPLRMYLGGELGSDPDDVNAYAASSFFAVDRYAGYVKDWRGDYEGGAVIIANRYTTANAYHQMCKLPREKWDGFLEWLFDYEYGKLGLPVPDAVVLLHMDTAVSSALLSARYGGDESRRDIHERSRDYQNKAEECALYAAERCGWRAVECSAGGAPLPVEEIRGRIWEAVRDAL